VTKKRRTIVTISSRQKHQLRRSGANLPKMQNRPLTNYSET